MDLFVLIFSELKRRISLITHLIRYKIKSDSLLVILLFLPDIFHCKVLSARTTVSKSNFCAVVQLVVVNRLLNLKYFQFPSKAIYPNSKRFMVQGEVSIHLPLFSITKHYGEPAKFQSIKTNSWNFKTYRHHVVLKVEIFEISRFARVSAHITSLFFLKRGKTFSAISAHKNIKLSNFREFKLLVYTPCLG